jgi:hypothetical protein
VQAVLQQTPLAQNPLGHWLFDVQKIGSKIRAAPVTVVSTAPPAIRTVLFCSSTAL